MSDAEDRPADASAAIASTDVAPERFAQISIELMNFAQLAASVQDPAVIERCRQECLTRIEEMAARAGAEVESVRNNILFITFPRRATLQESVLQAVSLARDVIEEDLLFHQLPLKIRIGVDIEQADQRQPMTSAIERSVASPGMIVVSDQAYALMADVYSVEPIGPVRIGDGFRTFYRVLGPRAQAMPNAAIVEDAELAPGVIVADAQAFASPAEPATPSTLSSPLPDDRADGSSPDASALSQNPEEDDPFNALFPAARPTVDRADLPSTAPAASSDGSGGGFAASLAQARAQSVGPAPGDDVVPSVTPALPPDPAADRLPPEAVSSLSYADPPPDLSGVMMGLPPQPASSSLASAELPDAPLRDEAHRAVTGYCPPLFGERRTSQPPNARYEQGVETLIAELRGFIDDPGAAGRIVTLSSAEGVGKSYVVSNLLLRALAPDPRQPQMIWFQGSNYASLGGRGLPLMLWVEMFHNALPMILEGSDPAGLQSWLSHTLNHIYRGQVSPEAIRFWGDFFRINPPTQIQLDALDSLGDIERYMGDFLARMAQQMPVIIVIEDVEQADPASLELLLRMVENGLLRQRVCVLLTHDSAFAPLGRLAQALDQHASRHVVLSELNHEEIVSFLSSGPFAGTLETLSSQHIDDLMTYSGGRSIYLFEAIAYLQVSQVFWVNPQTGKLAPNPNVDQSALSLPASLEEMIQTRLDGLSPEQRYVLQVASALGERFTLKTLVDLCQFDIETLQGILEHLTVQQFIVSDFQQTGHFRHRIIWSLVYERMDAQLRADLHRLASDYLENLIQNRITVTPLLCAMHAERAGLSDRAFHYWNLAGVWCTQLGDRVGLNLAFARALSLLQAQSSPQTDDLAARLQGNLGMLNLDDAPDLAVTLLEQAARYSDAQDDVARKIETQGYLAAAYEANGRLQQAHDTLEKSLSLIPAQASPQERAILQASRLSCLYRLGRLEKTREALATEIAPLAARSDATDDPALAEAVLTARLLAHELDLWQCRPDAELADAGAEAAASDLSRSVAQAEQAGLTSLAMAMKLSRARGFLWRGGYESAERQLHGLLSEIESLARPDEALGQWGLLAMTLHLDKGDWRNAQDLTLHSMLKAEQARDFYTWILINAEAGRIAAMQGRHADARSIFEAMAGESADRRLATCALVCWRLLAETHAAENQWDAAREVAGRALEIAVKPDVGNTREQTLLTLVMARILLEQGEIRPAGELLQPLWPQVKRSGFAPLIADAASAVGELYAAIAMRVPEGVQRIQRQERAMQFFEIALTQWQQLRNPYQLGIVSARLPAA